MPTTEPEPPATSPPPPWVKRGARLRDLGEKAAGGARWTQEELDRLLAMVPAMGQAMGLAVPASPPIDPIPVDPTPPDPPPTVPPEPKPPGELAPYLPADAARTVSVSSLAKLEDALDDAEPGDLILIGGPLTELPSHLLITRAGTPERRITIAAEQLGAVKAGDIDLLGSYVDVLGLEFGNSSLQIGNGGSRTRGSRARRCAWSGWDRDGRIQNTLYGTDSVIECCEISRCRGRGFVIRPDGVGSTIRRTWLHDLTGDQNASEPIQICFGAQDHLREIRAIVEWCRFERCNLVGDENEALSMKALLIVGRNLHFIDTRNCTLRFGNFNRLERVRVEGRGEVLVHGQGHVLLNVWAPLFRLVRGDWESSGPGIPPKLSGAHPSAFELRMTGCQGDVDVGHKSGSAPEQKRARKIVIEAHRDGPQAIRNVQGGPQEWVYRDEPSQPVAEPPVVTPKMVGIGYGLAR